MKPRILVTSAVGNTGLPTVRGLLERGFPVRALVHRVDSRSTALQALGADVVVGNLQDFGDVSRALHGVQRAYFCAPLLPHALDASLIFAAAAQEQKLEAAVVMSQWLAHAQHPSLHTRATWLADRMFSWMPDVGIVTINPGWFADNYMAALEPIAQFGLMPMPLGHGTNAPPSNEDIASVIVEALARPDLHVGRRYRPTGPALLSPEDIAATYARVLQRPVHYVDAAPTMFSKVARTLGFPDYTILQVLAYFDDYKRNAFGVGAPTSAVQDVTGRSAETFESIVRRYVASARVARRSVGAMARAFAGLARIVATPALNASRYANAKDLPSPDSTALAIDSAAWLADRPVPARG